MFCLYILLAEVQNQCGRHQSCVSLYSGFQSKPFLKQKYWKITLNVFLKKISFLNMLAFLLRKDLVGDYKPVWWICAQRMFWVLTYRYKTNPYQENWFQRQSAGKKNKRLCKKTIEKFAWFFSQEQQRFPEHHLTWHIFPHTYSQKNTYKSVGMRPTAMR